MRQTDDAIDERLQNRLNQLRPAAPLDPAIAAAERTKFLAQANRLAAGVSRPPENRLREWITKISNPSQRKELSPMFSTVLTILLAVGILFGGAGTTVYAAQNSLPDQTLYPVKTLSEQVRLRLTESPEDQLGAVLQFTNRRMLELSELIAGENGVPLEWQTRFQQNLEDALQIAARLEDASMKQALAQIRYQADNQVRNVIALQQANPGIADPLLIQVQERLQEQARLAAGGENDPQGFREQIRDRDRLHWQATPFPGPSATQTPNSTPLATQNSFGPGPNAGPGAGAQSQFGPGGANNTQTPEPASNGYGPGPGPIPTNGSSRSYGPGPQAGDPTRTPLQDGSGAGQGPYSSTSTPQASGGGAGSGSGQPTVTPQPNDQPGSGGSDPSSGGGNKKP